ncbi:hypothetical protein POM88_047116 [Heracleum sosnowskyi]|uniref:Uncharacterized protein n=1 Tax=Heracleum sosnowskyi TaxID=360622 RepID=A0AAD8M7R5_9APIA|nr:hypothetical protein POM88_047116 [Heracleum sosnowskyi]
MDDNENVETHDTDGGNDQEDENTPTRSSRSSQSSDHSSHSTQSTAQSTQSTPSQSPGSGNPNHHPLICNEGALESCFILIRFKPNRIQGSLLVKLVQLIQNTVLELILPDTTNHQHCIINLHLIVNTVWQALDYVIAEANQQGVRLLLALVNNLEAFGDI